MKLSIHLAASDELRETAAFYSRQANQALGLAFIAEFERALGLLSNNPKLGVVWRGTARRFPLRRFPYHLVYQIKPQELWVIALAHQSRRPGYWKNRS